MPLRTPSRRAPIAVLLGSLFATAMVAWGFSRAYEARDRARFERDADDTVDALRDRFELYQALLYTTRGLFSADPLLDREGFSRYAARLQIHERYPGLQGLGFAPSIAHEAIPELVAHARTDGVPSYHVWPEGNAPESAPILYTEPMDDAKRAAMGFDLWSEPVRRLALEEARDTDRPIVTDRIAVLKTVDPKQPTAFVIYLPVYQGTPTTLDERRAQLRGWLSCGFRAGIIFRSIVGVADHPYLAVAVSDQSGALLHQSDHAGDPSQYRPSFSAVRKLPIANRQWTVELHTRPAFDELSSRAQVGYVLIFGILFSLALGAVMNTQVSARSASERAASRLQLLGEATAQLGSTLDYSATVDAATRLAVPAFADGCVITLDGQQSRSLDDLELTVPLTGHAGTLGSITFSLGPSGRRYSTLDTSFAEGLASRAAIAIENARLHADARTAEAEAEAQRARLYALFMQAPVAISIQEGPEQIYRLANSWYRQFLGNHELVGAKRKDVLPDVARLAGILDEVYRTGQPYDGREEIFKVDRGDGKWVEGYFNLICQPFDGPDGKRAGIITFGFEVTDLVRARKEKEALASDLEAAVVARDTFLAVASHELRTPLTTLQLQADGLQHSLNQPAAPVDAQRARYRVDKIQQQALRLNRLIADLLDVSRIAAGRLTIEPEELDLRALVEDVVARTEDAMTRAGCSLELVVEPTSLTGKWDRQRIDQVLINLLTNAAKYGAGKPIRITLGGDDAHVRVEVRDEGIGIAPADQARIFERFERAVSERNFGGLGLGLWISKQIVVAHGGEIRIVSEPDNGSTFTVELPRQPPAVEVKT